MAVRVLALFFVLSAVRGAACKDWQARLVNRIVDPRAVPFIDSHLKDQFPNTVGGCDNIVDQRPSLHPCKNISILPYTVPAKDVELSVHHITGFNTFNFTNLSFRCDAVNGSSDRKGWFVKMDTALQRLAVAVDAQMTSWPHLKISAYCGQGDQCLLDERSVKVQVIASLGCINEDSIGMVLNTDGGLIITPDVVLDWHGLKVDLMKPTEAAIIGVFSAARVDCKKVAGGKLDILCRSLCKSHYDRAEKVLV